MNAYDIVYQVGPMTKRVVVVADTRSEAQDLLASTEPVGVIYIVSTLVLDHGTVVFLSEYKS